MDTKYDLAVIGAGPAGLMTAKTAASKGLSVCVIERRKNIGKIFRACCAHLILDDDYENEAIAIGNGKIHFLRNGFEVNYNGPTLDLVHKYFYSPKGSKVHFSHKDGRPFAKKIDKGLLLKGLWEECESIGVEFILETVAYSAKDTVTGVKIDLSKRGKKTSIMAAKVIEAGGVNAHITGRLGMNRGRKLFATAHVYKFFVEGQKEYDPADYNYYFGQSFHSGAAVILDPSIYGEKIFEVVIMGSPEEPPLKIFEKVKTDSPISNLFENTKVIGAHGCSIKAFSALNVPYKGNVLSAGDAAAYVEVEIQGGLMCGLHAGNAVVKELSGGNGFKEYTRWWQESFEFNCDEYLQVAQGYALVPYYSDDELDYLFAMTEDEVLEGTNSQYKTPKLLWASILRHKEKIERERPVIFEKINKIDTMSLSETF